MWILHNDCTLSAGVMHSYIFYRRRENLKGYIEMLVLRLNDEMIMVSFPSTNIIVCAVMPMCSNEYIFQWCAPWLIIIIMYTWCIYYALGRGHARRTCTRMLHATCVMYLGSSWPRRRRWHCQSPFGPLSTLYRHRRQLAAVQPRPLDHCWRPIAWYCLKAEDCFRRIP